MERELGQQGQESDVKRPRTTKGEGTAIFLQAYGLLTLVAGLAASAAIILRAQTAGRAWGGVGVLLVTIIWSAVMWGLGVLLEHAIWIRTELEAREGQAKRTHVEPVSGYEGAGLP
jgi:hypothetical protein